MRKVTSSNIESGFKDEPPLKTAVMQWLFWSDLEYSTCQFESGMLYLEAYLGGNAKSIDLLSRSKLFWVWWRNHWKNRDKEFMSITKSVHVRELDMRRELYKDYHNGEKLVKEIHPNTVVLHESYTEMAEGIIKEQHE